MVRCRMGTKVSVSTIISGFFFIQRDLILKERDYNKIKRAKETPLISSFTICIILDGGFSKNSILLLMSSLSMLGSISAHLFAFRKI
jgi:hypothetical protein